MTAERERARAWGEEYSIQRIATSPTPTLTIPL